MPIEATNNFVVKFANVNGSGSASANELFARCRFYVQKEDFGLGCGVILVTIPSKAARIDGDSEKPVEVTPRSTQQQFERVVRCRAEIIRQ